MLRESADHLEVTRYMVRLKENTVYKNTQGGGGGFRLSAHGLLPIITLSYFTAVSGHVLQPLCCGFTKIRRACMLHREVVVPSQQTQNTCITFIQRRANVFDAGPTLYKCYTNVLCLLRYTGSRGRGSSCSIHKWLYCWHNTPDM